RHHNEDDLYVDPDRDIEQIIQAGVDLGDADAQGCRHAEYSTDDRKDIHCVPDGPVDALAEHRVQRRAQGQRQTMTESEVRQNERHDGIDSPGVQPPVEESDSQRLARSLYGAALADRWIHEMHDRLSHTEEHQAYAHAGSKKHRIPCEITEIRLTVIRTELDFPVAADGCVKRCNQDNGHGQHVKPAGITENPALNGRKQAL